MAKRRITPEEQLLDLIEKGDQAQAGKLKRRRKFRLSFGSLKNWLLSCGKGIGHGFARLKKGIGEPNLKVLNKVFFVLSIVLLSYSIIDFVFGRPIISELDRKLEPIRVKKTAAKAAVKPRPFLHYLEMVRRRNIFSPITLKEPEKPEVKKEQLEEMAKDLILVGISMEQEPIAMIEDKTAQKTYFLKKGDFINKLKIEEIEKGRVVLSYEGKTTELF